jgi:hypothetical protein
MLDWLDKATGKLDKLTGSAPRTKRKATGKPATAKQADAAPTGTHTFHLAAPLCMPLRRVYDDLYLRGIRPVSWQWMAVQDRLPKSEETVTVGQAMTLTVSNRQANWTEYLLRHLQQHDEEGFEIHSKEIDVRNKFHARRRGGKMPTPWIAKGCK